MILGLAAGWLLQSFAGVPNAWAFGLLLGMVGANLIPLGPGCRTPDD